MMRRVPHRIWIRVAVSAVITLLFLAGVITTEVTIRQSQQSASARATLQNCLQIEGIKTEIRDSIILGIAELPATDYYKTHPIELAQAQKDSRTNLHRLRAMDCYKLPNVVRYGIHPPPKKGKRQPAQ